MILSLLSRKHLQLRESEAFLQFLQVFLKNETSFEATKVKMTMLGTSWQSLHEEQSIKRAMTEHGPPE